MEYIIQVVLYLVSFLAGPPSMLSDLLPLLSFSVFSLANFSFSFCFSLSDFSFSLALTLPLPVFPDIVELILIKINFFGHRPAAVGLVQKDRNVGG